MSAIDVQNINSKTGSSAITIADSGDISLSASITFDTDTLYVDASSNSVGIRTTSPSFPLAGQLHISGGTGYVGLNLQKGSTGTGHLLEFTDENNTLQYRIGTNFASGGQNLLFAYGSTPTVGMALDSSGKVGIGTTSPDQTLHVHKGSAGSVSSNSFSVLTLENDTICVLQTLVPSGSSAQLRFGDAADDGKGILSYDHSTDHMQFNVNGPERMRITSSGYVGIGTSAPESYGYFVVDRGAPSSADRIIASFMSQDTRRLNVVWDDSASTLGISNRQGQSMAFHIGGIGGSYEKMRILSSGGITFNADTAAANALDDYEEGVHTTSVTAGSGTPSISSTENKVSYTAVGDSVSISGQLGSINCSGCSGTLSVTMPFTTKTNTDRSDFYFFMCASTISTIEYFYLSQTGGGSSTFFVNAKKSDGSVDSNVATLLASHGVFDLNIIGATYKKA